MRLTRYDTGSPIPAYPFNITQNTYTRATRQDKYRDPQDLRILSTRLAYISPHSCDELLNTIFFHFPFIEITVALCAHEHDAYSAEKRHSYSKTSR